MATINPTPRSTTRGRPRVTTGALECSRCHRMANKLRVGLPDLRGHALRLHLQNLSWRR
jgi:hypothetical protein